MKLTLIHLYKLTIYYEKLHMTRDEIIDLLGEDDQIKHIVVCDNANESLLVGPIIEKIYGVPESSWETSSPSDYWKYLFLSHGMVNAYRSCRDPSDKYKNAALLPACEFVRIALGICDVVFDDLL